MQPSLVALLVASVLAGPPSDTRTTTLILVELPTGGWASITPDSLPASVAAGAKVELRFLVKQHGVTPLAGLKPTVLLNQNEDAPTKIDATAGKSTGWYVANLVFPKAGDWHITIDSGFGKSKTTLPIQKVGPSVAASQ